MRIIDLIVCVGVTLLNGCNAPNTPAPGGVTHEEADALNAAAANLDDSLPPAPTTPPPPQMRDHGRRD